MIEIGESPKQKNISNALRDLSLLSRAVVLLLLACLSFGYVGFSFSMQSSLPSDGALWAEVSFSRLRATRVWFAENDLQPGDRLLAVDGRPLFALVDDAWPLNPALDWQVDQSVVYQLERAGEPAPIERTIDLVPFVNPFLVSHRLDIYSLVFLSLILGSYMLLYRPADAPSQLFFLCVFGLALSLLLHIQVGLLASPLFWLENAVRFLARSLVVSSFLHFCLIFPVPKPFFNVPGLGPRRRHWLRTIHVLIPVLSVLIGSVVGRTPDTRLAGAWQTLIWMGLLALVLGMASLVHTYLTVREPQVRGQIYWIIGGSALGLLPYLVLNGLPQAILGHQWIAPDISIFFVIAVPIGFTAAIARFRLFNLRILIRRTLLYTFIVAILVILYIGALMVFGPVFSGLGHVGTGVAVFLALLVVAGSVWILRQQVVHVTNRILYPDQIDSLSLLDEMSDRLGGALRLDEIEDLLVCAIPERINATPGSFQVFGQEELQVATREGRKRLLVFQEMWSKWSAHGAQPIIPDMAPKWLPLDQWPDIVSPDTGLVMPLVVGDQLVGLWSLGRHRSYSAYTSRERNTLNTLAKQAAISIQNARLVRQLEAQSQWLVSEVQRRTKDLEDERNRLSVILEHMADGLLVTDIAGVVRLFNAALARMLQGKVPWAVGQSLTQILGDQTLNDLLTRALDNPGHLFNEHLEFNDRVFYISTTALEDRSNVITVFRDITREAEVDRLKSEFIAIASHELRTPLTSILGFAKLVQRTFDRNIRPNLPEQERVQRAAVRVGENLSIIAAEGSRLTDLIGVMLDLAKIREGTMEWHDQRISIRDVVQQVMTEWAEQAENQGLTLDSKIVNGLPLLMIDPERLRQVLSNLVSNALKYTHDGCITVTVSVVPADKACPHWVPQEDVVNVLRVEVQDTGVGIPLDKIDRLFTRFQAGGDVIEEKPQGTGLGLALCHEIVSHYNGTIWADSSTGQGSTFFFVLPINQRV